MTHSINRRAFLKRVGMSLGAVSLGVPRSALAALDPMTFGLCADVHQDVMHDAPERLTAFVDAMEARNARFIAQLGDFCVPKPANRAFLDIFNGFTGEHYHVLGNHDTDADNLTKKGYSQQETKKFWGMDGNAYSFVQGGIRFIAIDGNDPPGTGSTDYPRHVGSKQLTWLARELEGTSEPVIMLSHQSAENEEGLDNAGAVREVLERANDDAGYQRVLACFSGHHHLNYAASVKGIPYVQVNSMSYFWVGDTCENFAYSPETHARHPMLQFTAPYRDPIWTTVEVDPSAGEIRIAAMTSEWAGTPPDALGYESPPSRRRGMSPATDARTLPLAPPRPRR